MFNKNVSVKTKGLFSHVMNTDELINALKEKFGDINAVYIEAVDVSVNDDFVELAGAVLAYTSDDKVICSKALVKARCSFIHGIYSSVPVGLLLHKALDKKIAVYTFFVSEAGVSHVMVPCLFDVDVNKFAVTTSIGMPCPLGGTSECPLYGARNNDNDSRIPIII